jgi:hypothetical protein
VMLGCSGCCGWVWVWGGGSKHLIGPA